VRNSIFRLLSLALLTLALGLVQAQAKSDFSGTWKADLGKSDFGPAPPPDTLVMKIAHEDPKMKATIAQTGGQGDLTYDMIYTTDGKECVNHPAGNEFKSTLQWEGDDLVANTKGSWEGTDFAAKERWTLSDGGKTMIMQRHISAGGNDFDMKLVFEKQ
jgi:hypothetical protein